MVAWDVRARRPLWRLPAHTPSSGALHAELAPGSSARVLTQGRDGTLKCWRTSGGGDGGDPPTPPRAPPSWTLSSGSYHYCKFATRESAGDDGTGALVAVAGETQSALDVCEMPSLNDEDDEDDEDDDDEEDADADTPRMGAPRRLASLIAAADREHASASSRGSPVESPSNPSESRDRLGVVMAVAFLPPTRGGHNGRNGRRVAILAAHEEGTVCLWRLGNDDAFDEPDGRDDAEPDEPTWRSRVHRDAATCLAADATGDGFVSGGADGACVRFRVAWGDDDDDIPGGSKARVQKPTVETLRSHGPFAPRNPNVDAAGDVRALVGVAAVAVRDDAKIFAAGYWDGRVRLFEYGARSSGRTLASFGYHEHAATCVAFAPSRLRGREWAGHAGWLASGSRDGTVAMWAVYPPKEDGAKWGEGDGDDG